MKPAKGFKYIYLSEDDYEMLGANGRVLADRVVDDETGEVRFALTDVCGGQGVECLQGSGEIASATSRAYKSTVTMAYVTGRSVGIGAYCSRLCQRVIQHTDAPLILTGASALNKVLGREVYTSNAQIGGPRVMGANGVSHVVVSDDVRGVSNILRWLSYVPERRGRRFRSVRAEATASTRSTAPWASARTPPRTTRGRCSTTSSTAIRSWRR